MIKFGFTYNESYSLQDIETLYKEGLRVIELNLNVDEDFLSKISSIPFEFTYHVGFLGGINPSFPVEGIRKAAVSEIFKEIDFAKSINANHLTIHGGFISWFDFIDPLLPEFQFYNKIAETERKRHLDALKDSVSEILKFSTGMDISVENLYFPFDLLNSPLEIFEIVNNFDSLNITLDFGHAKLTPYKIFDYVSLLSNKISKLHLHTNDGKYDLHRPIDEDALDEDFIKSLLSISSLDKQVIGIIELHRDAFCVSKSFKNIQKILKGGVA